MAHDCMAKKKYIGQMETIRKQITKTNNKIKTMHLMCLLTERNKKKGEIKKKYDEESIKFVDQRVPMQTLTT